MSHTVDVKSVTKRMQLAVRYASTAEQVAELLEVDAEYRNAAAELQRHTDEDRYDDVYYVALERYTQALHRRASAIAHAEGRSHG